MLEYRYNLVEVLKFIDADTLKVRIGKDVGFGTFITWDIKLRLTKVNCPEKGTPDHQKAIEFVRNWFNQPGEIIVETAKSQTFDRWLGTITRDGINLSDELLNENLAVIWKPQ
jgi:endonuclease YncB( thermonuclease family)